MATASALSRPLSVFRLPGLAAATAKRDVVVFDGLSLSLFSALPGKATIRSHTPSIVSARHGRAPFLCKVGVIYLMLERAFFLVCVSLLVLEIPLP